MTIPEGAGTESRMRRNGLACYLTGLLTASEHLVVVPPKVVEDIEDIRDMITPESWYFSPAGRRGELIHTALRTGPRTNPDIPVSYPETFLMMNQQLTDFDNRDVQDAVRGPEV